MLPAYLHPEKNAETDDAEQVRSFLENDFAVTYLPASLSDLDILPDGLAEVSGKKLPYTQDFLESLASAIGMPTAYAYDIEFGLFRHNLDERKKVKDRAIKVCVIDGRAVGLAGGEYRPARTIDVLDALPTVNDGFWTFQKSSFSNRFVQLDLLSNDFVVEPRRGDEIRVGIRIINSETGDCGLKASLFTHRLVCANGAVMSDWLGTVRWNYDKRVTYVSSIAKFTHGLLALGGQREKLERVYSTAPDRSVLEEDMLRLWRRIRPAARLTPEAADGVLGITHEQRLNLASGIEERRSARLPAEASLWDVFTIHNRVTAAAKSLPLRRRSRLERIGGDFLSDYSTN